jgi:hypothetical protein
VAVSRGRYPDHYTAGRLGYQACFVAGLKQLKIEGEEFCPFKVLYATAYYREVRPTFVVDVLRGPRMTGYMEAALAPHQPRQIPDRCAAETWPTIKTSSEFGQVAILSAAEDTNMKEPGLDKRHRDKALPKAGEIQQKRGDTLNKNLPNPIPQFSPNTKLSTMRKETGKVSEDAVRRAAKILRPDK